MAFVPVPKDLTKVKTKVALNLTKRQLICFGLGSLMGIPAYLFTRGSMGNEAAALLMIGLMLPFFAFGIYEKDGQPLEKVLGNFISASFLRPKERPYRTNNGYAALMRQAEADREVEEIENKAAGRTGKSPESRRRKVQERQGRVKGNPADPGKEADKKGKKASPWGCGESKARREDTKVGAGNHTLQGDAGINDLVAANQEQLDAWLAEN